MDMILGTLLVSKTPLAAAAHAGRDGAGWSCE